MIQESVQDERNDIEPVLGIPFDKYKGFDNIITQSYRLKEALKKDDVPCDQSAPLDCDNHVVTQQKAHKKSLSSAIGLKVGPKLGRVCALDFSCVCYDHHRIQVPKLRPRRSCGPLARL